MTTNEDASAQPPRRESSHKDLIVWRKAMDLANESMKLADMLPQDEKHILVREIVRTAVRIPTKIAQGHDLPARGFLRHLDNARGAVWRLRSTFDLALMVGYLDENNVSDARLLADEVDRLLMILLDKLGARKWE
jgi:four helix bundle protein